MSSAGSAIDRFIKRSRGILESDVCQVDRRLKHLLKQSPLREELLSQFAALGCTLQPGSTVLSVGGWKWRIRGRRRTYVVRDRGDHLLVSRERVPAVSSLVGWTRRVLSRTSSTVRNQVFYATASARKRYVDRPTRKLINVGAGRWYVPDWRVIDYTGDWYRYGRRFVDYPLDLMTKTPFPFGDESVDLFYSEHVFEHFPNDVTAFTFAQMHRTLKRGGGFRIVVPDADLLWERYRHRDEHFFEPWMNRYNATLTEAFIILVGYREAPLDERAVERDFETLDRATFFDRYTTNLRYDYSRAGEHINWFNFEKMKRLLEDAGFGSVALSSPQQSRFPEIRGKGFDTRPHYSLHVDALKGPASSG